MRAKSSTLQSAIAALSSLDWSRASLIAQTAIDNAKQLSQKADPTLYIIQGIALFKQGAIPQAMECFRYVMKNKRSILKWGVRGFRVISFILAIFAMPDRAGHFISMIGDALKDEIA